MAKKIKQFSFFEREESKDSNKTEYTFSEIQNGFITGSIFEDYYPIYQLGIQTLPGVRFKLNNSNDFAYIGHSGVFELDLNGKIEINSLQFFRGSMKLIDENPAAYLIVDIVYDDEEV